MFKIFNILIETSYVNMEPKYFHMNIASLWANCKMQYKLYN